MYKGNYRTWATVAAGLNMSLASNRLGSWNLNKKTQGLDGLTMYRKHRKKKNKISAQSRRKNR